MLVPILHEIRRNFLIEWIVLAYLRTLYSRGAINGIHMVLFYDVNKQQIKARRVVPHLL
jgi:hypothetical protein